jgi:hypothetical protein
MKEIVDDRLPGVEHDTRPAVSSSDTTPIDVAIVPVCTCFVASVHVLRILAIHVAFVSRQCALCISVINPMRSVSPAHFHSPYEYMEARKNCEPPHYSVTSRLLSFLASQTFSLTSILSPQKGKFFPGA